MKRWMRVAAPVLAALTLVAGDWAAADEPGRRIAVFAADVTIPLNHRCMGVLPQKSVKIADPLEARGLVLLGDGKPIVVVAVDWCEIRNGAYDQWRTALAEAAGTTPQRVMVSSIHQHDAPVTDLGAAELLASVGLRGELYDEAFHRQAVTRVALALREALARSVPLTHIGTGQAKVDRVASSRRVVAPGAKVSFARGSRSAGNPLHRDAPEGEIDPYLKTLSFWHGQRPVAALSVYATHPMSSYGRGEVSADFVGLARRKRQIELPDVHQIYASGCSGDVTAGKYNDGSPASRIQLIERMRVGMSAAWDATTRWPLQQVTFRNAVMELPYHPGAHLDERRLSNELQDATRRVEDRILAAMGLSSRRRVQAGRGIDVPAVDLGKAQLVLLPGEAFVGYQLMAQQLRPDGFVVCLGYGECWPGYIPTKAAFDDHFHDKWLWVGPGCENKMRRALQQVLAPPSPK